MRALLTASLVALFGLTGCSLYFTGDSKESSQELSPPDAGSNTGPVADAGAPCGDDGGGPVADADLPDAPDYPDADLPDAGEPPADAAEWEPTDAGWETPDAPDGDY